MRIRLVGLFLVASLFMSAPGTSQAAPKEDVAKAIELIKTKQVNPIFRDLHEFKLVGDPLSDTQEPITVLYGTVVQSESDRARQDAQMQKYGLKPLPDTNVFGFIFPLMRMCIVWVIDAELSGEVSHSGMDCHGLSGFIGLTTGPGDSFFEQQGGVQAFYDRLLGIALTQMQQ